MNVQTMRLADIRPADYNPRKQLKPEDQQYQKLENSLKAFGYVEPIIWNKRTGNVVGGHQRLTVLLNMGKTEAEVVVVDLPQHEEKQLNLLLNRAKGHWDDDKLADLLSEIDEAGGIDLTGFDEYELQGLIDSYDDQLRDILDDSFAYEEESRTRGNDSTGKRGSKTEQQTGQHSFDMDFNIPDEEEGTINDYLQQEERALDYLAEAVVLLVRGVIDDED